MNLTEFLVVCSRCGKRTSVEDATDWNMQMEKGRVVAVLCGGCQTPEENAEAVINQATLDYSVDSFGRVVGRPR